MLARRSGELLVRGRGTVDSALKQRLVGAIVLVALAVIFLPMLLDGSGHSGPRDIAIELPAEPQPPRNRLEESDDFADTGLASHAQEDGQTAPAGAAGASPSDEAIGTESDSLEAEEARNADRGEDGQANAGGDSATEDRQPDAAAEAASDEAQPASDTDGWVVQVGSFTRETNALVLRDRLREADFEAFVERTDNGERTLWRVRIGPVGTREKADRLSERVAEQRGEPTLVMSHP